MHTQWSISINPSAGRYFPLKYLFGTCLNNFLINHSHTVLLLHLCQCEAERWGDLKIYIFGDVVLSVIGLGGAKKEVKRGRGITTTLRCLLIASTKFSVLEGACIWLVLILAILQVGCLSEIHVYIRIHTC